MLANLYEFVQSHLYVFVRYAFASVMSSLGVGLQYCFFLVIV